QVQNSAETGVANVTIAYSFYVQGTDAPLTSTQIITVPITQPDRFSFTSLDIPDEVYAGEENTITLNFVNKGKGILYNLSTEISGNINDPGQNQYIGNLASGTEGSVDFTVKTDGIGPVVGTITVIYEDVNGNEQKRTQEYSFNVIAAPKSEEMPMPDDMNPDGMPSAGMPWWGWLLIVGGAAGAGGTVIAVVKKKKAKQRAAALADEDDGDEGF
ncbi:MAG: CARDB domain-containing protein, partial [Ruthenibacterium sp.]